MSHVVDVLTALTLGGAIIGGGIKAVQRFTRAADSVEHRLETIANRLAELATSMEHVVTTIGDHEKRIDRLESH